MITPKQVEHIDIFSEQITPEHFYEFRNCEDLNAILNGSGTNYKVACNLRDTAMELAFSEATHQVVDATVEEMIRIIQLPQTPINLLTRFLETKFASLEDQIERELLCDAEIYHELAGSVVLWADLSYDCSLDGVGVSSDITGESPRVNLLLEANESAQVRYEKIRDFIRGILKIPGGINFEQGEI